VGVESLGCGGGGGARQGVVEEQGRRSSESDSDGKDDGDAGRVRKQLRVGRTISLSRVMGHVTR
jgi:hypothetical protein